MSTTEVLSPEELAALAQQQPESGNLVLPAQQMIAVPKHLQGFNRRDLGKIFAFAAGTGTVIATTASYAQEPPVRVAKRPDKIDLNPDMSGAEKRQRTVDWIGMLHGASEDDWEASLDRKLSNDKFRHSKWAEHFALGRYTREYPGGEFGENGVILDSDTRMIIFRVRVYDSKKKEERASRYMEISFNPTEVDYGSEKKVLLSDNPCGIVSSRVLDYDKEASVKWVNEHMIRPYLERGGKIASVSGD
jgi:hypothetical protein